MDVTYWHKLAQLYLIDELSLSEIVKLMIIISTVGIVEHDPDAIDVGINVLDNSGLNDAVIIGILSHQPQGEAITYSTLGQFLKKSPQTVAGSINRWIAKGAVTKEDRGVLGAVYTLHEEVMPNLPIWLRRFTAAIMEMHYDPELKAAVEEATKEIRFRRGFEIMRDELSQKFYRRPRDTDP